MARARRFRCGTCGTLMDVCGLCEFMGQDWGHYYTAPICRRCWREEFRDYEAKLVAAKTRFTTEEA